MKARKDFFSNWNASNVEKREECLSFFSSNSHTIQNSNCKIVVKTRKPILSFMSLFWYSFPSLSSFNWRAFFKLKVREKSDWCKLTFSTVQLSLPGERSQSADFEIWEIYERAWTRNFHDAYAPWRSSHWECSFCMVMWVDSRFARTFTVRHKKTFSDLRRVRVL